MHRSRTSTVCLIAALAGIAATPSVAQDSAARTSSTWQLVLDEDTLLARSAEAASPAKAGELLIVPRAPCFGRTLGAAPGSSQWRVFAITDADGISTSSAFAVPRAVLAAGCAPLTLGAAGCNLAAGAVGVDWMWQGEQTWVATNSQVGALASGVLPGRVSTQAAHAANHSNWPLIVGHPSQSAFDAQFFGIGVEAGWALAAQTQLIASAELARLQHSPLQRLTDSDLAGVGVGIAHGQWFAGVVGRVTRARASGQTSQTVGAVDFGIAWRAPWRAEVSFGAENLLSRPLDEANPAPVPALDARTPFVRYRQSF